MKLYLVHCGYYDSEVGNGVYEIHTNIFVVAENPLDAKVRAKKNDLFMTKRMHVDGVQEIEVVDGFKIEPVLDLSLAGQSVVNSYKHSQLSSQIQPNA